MGLVLVLVGEAVFKKARCKRPVEVIRIHAVVNLRGGPRLLRALIQGIAVLDRVILDSSQLAVYHCHAAFLDDCDITGGVGFNVERTSGQRFKDTADGGVLGYCGKGAGQTLAVQACRPGRPSRWQACL